MHTNSKHPTCVLCGKKIHPLQVSNALPLADGPCCVNCHYSIVYPTQMNNGRPSKWASKRNENGKLVYYFAVMNESEVKTLKDKILALKTTKTAANI